MKLDQLRKIIREEVRAAVKEELQDVMNEAVKYASTPTKMQQIPKGQPKRWSVGKSATLDEMLQDTKASMTGEDIKNITNGGGVQKPNFASMMSNQMVRETSGPAPGLDLSQIPGLNKAKAVLEAAYKKDKNRVK
tara:strand:+ start:194 stop:598 length:405 start_codon:yes stop_codon:yes gene_type:complete